MQGHYYIIIIEQSMVIFDCSIRTYDLGLENDLCLFLHGMTQIFASSVFFVTASHVLSEEQHPIVYVFVEIGTSDGFC